MQTKFDEIDAKILEGLGKHSPRNIKGLAKELKIPRTTVISRIKHMSSSFYLRILTTVYHTNLGMKKAVVFAKALPGKEDALLECLKVNSFYIYLGRCFGMFEGCIGIYAVPQEHTTEFQHFLIELKRTDVARDVQLFWSTCFHTVNKTRKWYDPNSETWNFPWDEWLAEIHCKGSDLPYTLIDPESFTMKADKTDLFIVKELEKDATISLTELGKKLGTTLQNVRYHYLTHVVKNKLIETFQIAILPFESTTSDMLFFIFRFDSKEKMAQFAQSLLDKPFVNIVGKVLGESAIVSQIYLPRTEFRNFIDALSKLARTGFLQSYDYVLQDLRPGKWARETIPYQLFHDGSWTYDHAEHIKNLHDLTAKLDNLETEVGCREYSNE